MSYTDLKAPGSFGGIQYVRRYGGEVKNLSRNDAYTLHESAWVRFPRRKTYSKGPGYLFQIDLVDLGSISSHNDGYRYLLTCLDVFNKRAWDVATKTKTGREVSRAFEKILMDGYKPNMVQSDKGTEFLNSTFQSMLKQLILNFTPAKTKTSKAAVVERFNRTLKTKMYCYFTAKNTIRYVDVLPDLLHSYNHTDMAPVEVDDTNEHVVSARLYPLKPKSYKWKYDVGDRVRMTMRRQPFKKGYLGRWSEEIFVIDARLPTVPVTYKLKDLADEAIKGKFYELEIQKVIKSDEDYFDVEKILKTRRRGGRIEYLVKWVGYPSKFNSWTNTLQPKRA